MLGERAAGHDTLVRAAATAKEGLKALGRRALGHRHARRRLVRSGGSGMLGWTYGISLGTRIACWDDDGGNNEGGRWAMTSFILVSGFWRGARRAVEGGSGVRLGSNQNLPCSESSSFGLSRPRPRHCNPLGGLPSDATLSTIRGIELPLYFSTWLGLQQITPNITDLAGASFCEVAA